MLYVLELFYCGLEKYKELVERSPNAIKILLTNRNSKDIKFPEVYSFDEILGKDHMEEYINSNLHDISIFNLLSFKKIYLYLRGISLHRRNETPKLLYIFLRSVINNQRIYVLDDDKRISGIINK